MLVRKGLNFFNTNLQYGNNILIEKIIESHLKENFSFSSLNSKGTTSMSSHVNSKVNFSIQSMSSVMSAALKKVASYLFYLFKGLCLQHCR